MIVVGCDLAKKGLAFLTLPSSDYIWIGKPKTKNIDELLLYYFAEARKIECDVLFIEDVVYVTNFKAILETSQILGVVRLAFKMRNIPVFAINNMTWKKEVLGNGHADKEQIKQFVKTSDYFSIPEKDLTDDIADAAAISLFGYLRMNK